VICRIYNKVDQRDQREVIYFFFRTLWHRDRFADVSKMIGHRMAGSVFSISASRSGPLSARGRIGRFPANVQRFHPDACTCLGDLLDWGGKALFFLFLNFCRTNRPNIVTIVLGITVHITAT
jgi:hypothetical protein